MKCSSCGTAIEASSASGFGSGLDGSFSRSETTSHVDADGKVHTTTRTTTVELGLLGALIKGVQGLFGR